MALPETGPLSFAEINVELGKAANAPITLGDAVVRALAGKASGALSFADLRGKAAQGIRRESVTYIGRKTFWFGAGKGTLSISGYLHRIKIRYQGAGVTANRTYKSGNALFPDHRVSPTYTGGIRLISIVDGIAEYETLHTGAATWRFTLTGTSMYVDVYIDT